MIFCEKFTRLKLYIVFIFHLFNKYSGPIKRPPKKLVFLNKQLVCSFGHLQYLNKQKTVCDTEIWNIIFIKCQI